ncbi:MAG: AMP-binding protein, partial [Thermoguttaceae bacterium]|nr:AMP-binding protein [Thermoguttaceae bacterium]
QILVLRQLLRKLLGEERFVGILMPTSVAGVLVNAAVGMDRRVPVNLNYTFTNDINNYCIKKIGVKKIVTTRQLLKKLPHLQLDAELVVLEDVKDKLTGRDKLIGFAQSLTPTWLLERILGLTKIGLDDPNTIIFTSGSTGLPKGAILTHANVSANMQSFVQRAMPGPKDTLLGTLPFFHSFGYTTTTWFPLCQPYGCIYHYNPLDYRGVAEMSRKYKPMIFPTTPTFMRTYLRRCEREDFEHLQFPVPGAEKTPSDLYTGWYEKFGWYPCEGYGATELSPVTSVCLPPSWAPDDITPYWRKGSVGQPNPNFVAKIVDRDTWEETPPGVPGMLIVKSNSMTPGYYEDPERTAAIFRDGWYVTGDIAKLDEQNFLFITDRETRMSKIGGEMAPHVFIEEKLNEAIRALESALPEPPIADEDAPALRLAVSAVADERKGERIVALYTEIAVPIADVCKKAAELGLPQLWIPQPVDFHQVPEIPILGTGKLNIKAVKETVASFYAKPSEN